MTKLVAEARDNLSAVWHSFLGSGPCGPIDLLGTENFNAFLFSKDWVQDTAEALVAHRTAGFSQDKFKAYLEFWGVLQAVFIQQDAIVTMYKAVTSQPFVEEASSEAWRYIRNLRNRAVGHPATGERTNPPGPTATGRQPKTYDRIILQITLEGGRVGSEVIALGAMIDAYDRIAANVIDRIRDRLSYRIGMLP